MSENKETYEKRRSLVNMSCSDLCIDYIKKTESILRNGYYHDHGAFYLLTYNSGGKEGLDVKQTINMNLTRSLSELTDVPEYFIMGTILTHYQEARRFDTIDILSELEGKKIIIADRDLVVCSNIDSEMFSSIKEWSNGGEVKKVDMKKPSCSDFIKGSESILRNGYYSDHELFYLITYNSGGGKGINVYQTVDYNLVDKLAFFLGFSDTTVDVTLLKHYEEARRFDSLNILKEIKDKPVIIVDRDTIVCSDYDRKTATFKMGGEVNKETKMDNQLSKGIEVELEHKETLDKVASGDITPEQGVEETAKTHIEEDPMYYDKLEEMENKTGVNSIDKLISNYKITSDSATKALIENAIEKHDKININNIFEFADKIAKHDKEEISIMHVAEAIKYEIDRAENKKDAFTISLNDFFDVLTDSDNDYFVPANKERIHEVGLSDETYLERLRILKEIKKLISNSQNETIIKVSLDNIKYFVNQNEYSFNEIILALKDVSENADDIKTLVEKIAILDSKIKPQEIETENTLEMTSEAPTKKEETKEEKDMSNIGVDDWSKIPDSNKYITKVVSKAFAYDPYDKVFQSITGNFTANDSFRPVMAGVFFGKSGICVTNAHILLYMNHVSNKFEEGTYCVSPDCLKVVPEDQIKNNMIDAKFPNYEAVVPISQPYVYEIDLLSVKTYCETLIRSKYVNQTTKVVLFTYDNNRIIGFNGRFMIDACDSLLKMGYNRAKIGLSEPSRAGLIVPDMSYDGSESPMGKSDFALIMPAKVKYMTESDVFDHTTFQGDTDFEIGGNLAYSFEKDAVITAGGNITHKIDTTLTKEKAKQINSVKPELISIISSVLKRSRAIPILDYVLVKDGGIESTDLETHFRVTGVNLPDGMYALNGDSLFPDKHEAEDYPIFPPRKFDFNKIGDINRQEFLFHFKKCLDFVGSDELRPVMSGIHLSKEGDKLVIEATDANALYRAEIEKFNIDGDFSVIIPNPKLVHKLLNVFDCDDIEFSLNKESNGLSMTCGEGSIYSRLIDGEYPNTSRVYPTRYDKVIKLKTADLKRILNEIKVEKKKAGIKPSEMFSVAFNPTDGKYEIAYVEYSGGYNRERKFTKYKTGDISIPIIHGENDLDSKTYPLIMPTMLGEGYSEGSVIGISDYNIDRIISLGYSEFEMALSEPTKAIVIINKPVIFGTKETTMQKEKKAKKDTIVDPIEPVVEKTDESQQIKDSIEGLEIIKKLTRNKRERQEYQDAIDGLRLLLNAEETFSYGGKVEAEKETFAI